MLADQFEALALEHSLERGLVKPFVVARQGDLRVPFATAVWIRDGHGQRLGMVLQRDVGVMLEFDAEQYQPGQLPPAGMADLLPADSSRRKANDRR